MRLRNRPPFVILLGSLLLALAIAATPLSQRIASIPEGLRDGGLGLLFGVAIGCLLLGLWKMRHHHDLA